MTQRRRNRPTVSPAQASTWTPEALEMSLAGLALASVLTGGLYLAYWIVKRHHQLEALDAPRPVPHTLAYGAAGSLAVAMFLLVAYDERLLVTGLLLATLAWEDRVLRLLQWRAEQLGRPFRMSYAGLLLFRSLYVQDRMNHLADLEREALEGRDVDGEEDEESEDDDQEAAPLARMKNRVFWDLVDHVDRDALAAGDQRAAVEPLRDALARLEPTEIERFAETLAQKLHAFDGPMFVDAGGEGSATAKGFLWARCHVVARGQEIYQAVLASPERMPQLKAERCAALLRAAPDAYEQTTGEEWRYEPSADVRRGSNVALWG